MITNMNISQDSQGSTEPARIAASRPAYSHSHQLSHALVLLGADGARPLGGGTDLIPSIRERVVQANALVDLTGVDELSRIRWAADGGVEIGSAVTLSTIADDSPIRTRYPALAEACAMVGSPALRNMGTLGGNLCQRPRCWYFRQGLPCHKHGGSFCYAYDGESEYHAILGGGPCYIVHPSDAAVALVALGATLRIAGPSGERRVPIDAFFVLPSARLDAETVLLPGEVVVSIELPAESSGGRQRFDKVMQRGSWDFAVVSLAGVRWAGGTVRLVLGGVAPIPWRVNSSIEEDVASGALGPDDIDTLAERALYDAQPLAKNGYKVDIALALLRRAIADLNRA